MLLGRSASEKTPGYRPTRPAPAGVPRTAGGPLRSLVRAVTAPEALALASVVLAVVSLSGGALFANVVSVVLLVVETVTYHRSK